MRAKIISLLVGLVIGAAVCLLFINRFAVVAGIEVCNQTSYYKGIARLDRWTGEIVQIHNLPRQRQASKSPEMDKLSAELDKSLGINQ